MEMAAWANIALTTIHQPFEAIVRASVDLIAGSFDSPGRRPRFACSPATWSNGGR